MKNVDEYINNLDDLRRFKIVQVIDYIRKNYKDAVESLDYAPKTKFPFFKYKNTYVAIASMKNHISVHFGCYDATKIVFDENNKVITRVGCVNIKDNIDFPIEGIKKAIDHCFKEE